MLADTRIVQSTNDQTIVSPFVLFKIEKIKYEIQKAICLAHTSGKSLYEYARQKQEM